MMTLKWQPKTYKVAVYWRDDDGVWHHHGTWEGEAATPSDAKYKVVDALSDVRVESWKGEILEAKKRPML